MTPLLLANATTTGFAGFLALIFFAVIIAATVWFFVGPARHADDYVKMLTAQIGNVDDRVLFQQMYQVKHPKNVIVAWLLTAFLSPTISYAYRNKWGLAALAFVKFQGFGVWWLVSLFTTPFEVMNQNKGLAEAAFTELKLARPSAMYQVQTPVQPILSTSPTNALTRSEDLA